MAEFTMARPGTSFIGDFLLAVVPVSAGWFGCAARLFAGGRRAHVVLSAGDLWLAGHALVQPARLSCGLGAGSVVASEASPVPTEVSRIVPVSEPIGPAAVSRGFRRI